MSETRRDSFKHDFGERLMGAITHRQLEAHHHLFGGDIDFIIGLALMSLDQIAPSTLLKADIEEPVFVLRAQDMTAADTVRDWISRNFTHGSDAKLDAAIEDARAMDEWPVKKQAD